MSSSSVNNDSGHSGDDHDDAVLASHQDIKPSINILGADDNNLSSSQDDTLVEQRVNRIRKQLRPSISKHSWTVNDEQEIDDEFLALQDKDLVSNNNFRSFHLSDKPGVRKVSLSPPSKDTTLVLSSSGERRIPFQPLNENRNQLSSSLSTTKPSSQQLDTSCDVDINNTKQPSPTTAQSFIERKSIELQCIQKRLVQVPRATALEVSAMQQDYAYGETAIICDENLNQMKGHYDEECPVHDILNFSTDQLAYIRRMRDKMPKDELAQYIMDAEMALRLKILLAVPEDMQNLLTFGTKLNPGHQCLTGQNYPATHELERQSQEDREILNLCLPDDGCVNLLNVILPLALLDMVYGEGKKVADIPEFRTGILSKMGQFDISCAGYDNLDGTQSGNRRVVDALAKKMHKSMTRSDFYLVQQKGLGFRIELNHTIRPDLKMVISFSTAYVTKEDLYDERLKSQDVETKLALFLRVVTHTASIYSEGFRANYSPKQIKEMDSSFSKLLCPIVLPGYDGEIYPLLTDFGDKSKMSHQSYELVQKQRDENLTKARQVWAEILRKAKANEPLTKKEQKSVDKFNKHHAKTSDMWKRFNSGKDVTPHELSIIRKVTKGGEKGGEKGGATVKAAWDKYHDGEWEEMSLEQQSIIIAQQEGLQQFLDEAMEIRSTIDTIKSNLDGDDQFDREHALEFFKEEGCNPSALSKVMFEVDCREAKIKYVSDSAAGRDMVKIFADIENEFGTNVFSWLKSGVEQSNVLAKYNELIESMNPNDALAEIEASNKFSAGSISHLKSTVVERSEVMSLYNELKAKNNSHDACIAEIKASNKISVGSINWLMGSKNGTTTVSDAHKAVKSKTIKATKKQEDMVVKQKQGAANGLASQHAAKAAVADPNRNASKRQQVIAKNVDEGRKKYSNTRKLNEDIKTLENGEEEDIVKLQCAKKSGCGDIRPFDSSESSVHNQQVGQMFSFGDGRAGISCSCSGRHTSWELVCVDPEVASYLDNLKDQAEKMKAAQIAEKNKRQRERKAAKKNEKAAKATELDGDASKPPTANTKSGVVHNNKSTSSKATVVKRKSSEDKGKRKRSKANNGSSNEEEEKKTNPVSKGGKKVAPAKKLDTSKDGKKVAPAKKKGPKAKKKAINTKSGVGTSSRASNKPPVEQRRRRKKKKAPPSNSSSLDFDSKPPPPPSDYDSDDDEMIDKNLVSRFDKLDYTTDSLRGFDRGRYVSNDDIDNFAISKEESLPLLSHLEFGDLVFANVSTDEKAWAYGMFIDRISEQEFLHGGTYELRFAPVNHPQHRGVCRDTRHIKPNKIRLVKGSRHLSSG